MHCLNAARCCDTCSCPLCDDIIVVHNHTRQPQPSEYFLSHVITGRIPPVRLRTRNHSLTCRTPCTSGTSMTDRCSANAFSYQSGPVWRAWVESGDAFIDSGSGDGVIMDGGGGAGGGAAPPTVVNVSTGGAE